ncbi:putative bifunctional diguanylate cyclase/phosphodiesterase [Rhizobium sp. CFBP 13726]|uniref:putative bifunctional diguanylate cyclase/phosphodiesterase n=1 Tax=Rhizobium sp. CFBP 13726 TaxID=2775296 RepID=UPI002017C971|nr:EAL domain-containing protein [Rhizobium sp. CFBP 13726]
MALWRSSITERFRPFSSACAPAVAAFLVSLTVIVTAVVLDHRFVQKHRDDIHAATTRAAGTAARQIASRLELDFAVADSLRNALIGQAGYKPNDMQTSARQALADLPHLSAVIAAPGFTPTTFFRRDSLAGETGIDLAGLKADLDRAGNKARPSVLTGSQTGRLTLIMPVPSASGQEAGVWGALVLVLDVADLLDPATRPQVGDAAQTSETVFDWLDLALVDNSRADQAVFYGIEAVKGGDPVRWSITVKGTDWQILAAPRVGWNASPAGQMRFRLILALASLAIVLPVLIATSLISERNRHIETLRLRENKLFALSRRFGLAMEASMMGIWEVTDEGVQLSWDDRSAALHANPSATTGNRFDDWMASIAPEDRAVAEAHLFTVLCTDSPSTETYRLILPGGDIRHLRSAGARVQNERGIQATGIVWDVTADVTMAQTLRDAKDNSEVKNAELELALDELSDREQELEGLSRKLDLALGSYGCGVWEYDPATGSEIWDARMCQLYGVAPIAGPLPHDFWLSLLVPEDRQSALDAAMRYLSGDVEEALIVRVPQSDGSLRYIRSVGQLVIGRDGSRKLIGLAFDVTKDAVMTTELKSAKAESDARNVELQMAKTRIEHNALHDPLTMLGNRRKLDMELDHLSRASQVERQKFFILHLDLDRFKQINDTMGHAAGDAMLVHSSRILSRNVRDEDIVARIGGDEFVILMNNSASIEDVAELSQRIIAEFRQPFDFDGFSCRCGVSIGIAQATGLNVDARRTLVNADIALYRAKGLGRNRFEFFTLDLQEEIVSHKRTADEVLSAIDNGEFVTWYQPQFCARTGELTGAEALLRWNHPHHGILAPARFLRIAEDLNVSAVLDQIVLETVLKDKMRWTALGLKVPKVSVNVSSKRLHDENLIANLESLSITPGEICFELVESIFLDDGDVSVSGNIERIKGMGIDIEIDDFGTGHTSIVSLLKLKPKRLKIDRQLVMPILEAPQERTMVRSIVDIARSLGIDTVAEGVETMQHAELLRELGCDLLQGYAFAKALPFDEFVEAARADWLKQAA